MAAACGVSVHPRNTLCSTLQHPATHTPAHHLRTPGLVFIHALQGRRGLLSLDTDPTQIPATHCNTLQHTTITYSNTHTCISSAHKLCWVRQSLLQARFTRCTQRARATCCTLEHRCKLSNTCDFGGIFWLLCLPFCAPGSICMYVFEIFEYTHKYINIYKHMYMCIDTHTYIFKMTERRRD